MLHELPTFRETKWGMIFAIPSQDMARARRLPLQRINSKQSPVLTFYPEFNII